MVSIQQGMGSYLQTPPLERKGNSSGKRLNTLIKARLMAELQTKEHT